MKTNKTKSKTSFITRAREQRLGAILECIAAGNYPNSTTLGKMFEITRKVLCADIDILNRAYGQNIEFDFSLNGYYCLTKAVPMPACHAVNEEEILVLHLLEKACNLLKGLPQNAVAQTALQKVIATLSESVNLPKGWKDIVSFHITAECLFKPEIFNGIFKAGLHHERSKMLYRKFGREERYEERIVEVHHISIVNNECYVFAWDVKSQKMRTYIPARIKSVESTGEKFKRKKFSIEERLKHSFKIFTGDEMHDVAIEFEPEVADLIREKKWGGQQGLRELDNGGVELHLMLSSLAEVHWWLLGFSGAGIPNRPIKLLELMLDSGRKIVTEVEKKLATLAPASPAKAATGETPSAPPPSI